MVWAIERKSRGLHGFLEVGEMKMADISQYLMPVDTNIEIASVILSDENKDKIQRTEKSY